MHSKDKPVMILMVFNGDVDETFLEIASSPCRTVALRQLDVRPLNFARIVYYMRRNQMVPVVSILGKMARTRTLNNE